MSSSKQKIFSAKDVVVLIGLGNLSAEDAEDAEYFLVV
jgi:hypothetical protein